MTTKLHKAYSKNKNAYYYFKCDCSNMFIARNDANPKSCGCLIGKPKTVDIETNINQIESIPKTHKNCWKCKTILPLDKFNKGTSCCKDCFREYKKEYQNKNKDKVTQYNKQHRLNQLGLNEEEYQELKKTRINKAKENKEKILKRRQKAEELRKQLELKKLSPVKECIKCGEIKPKSEFFKSKGNLDGYDNRCYWCSTSITKTYHIDHYEPLSKGGEHLIQNIVLACPHCNMSKHDKDPLEFANKLGRLL